MEDAPYITEALYRNIRGGPTLTVLLRVNVTVPDVKMSMDNVDFGTITCGQCKAVYLQLHNYREVHHIM